MGTTLRPEPAKSNHYWMNKHVYYELEHFCMQYELWILSSDERDKKKIRFVKYIAENTDPILGKYILKAVVTGTPYDKLNAREEIPCSKDTFYNLRRKFFWLMHQAKENGGRIPTETTTD